ncbi:SDR family oxidoreductase [Rhodophyticola sp. CCM32]|uniref:SDR family NAD(P)-dependent oxidoreductase n=1 Tax=Rhodophyticola sp. CCM32 TaxID=2916397 RepID=UPI00107F9F14|nr:SDR family oxidoreductase [Rhodophyticola sp. CCM32]QBX99889.1 SDR family oxidoreductase [Rhodophyticola sp. CCM32]
MELNLTSRLTVITGAARGIGAAAAEAFAAEAAHLLLVDRDPDVEDMAATLGGNAYVGDLAEPGTAAEIASAAEPLGGAAILVNNAGISRPGALAEITDQDWAAVMDINVSAAFRLTRALWGQLQHHDGAVINLASFASKRSTLFGNNASYVASKHAIAGLTRAAAFEGAQTGVRVNAVAPGVVETDLVKLHDAETREKIRGFIPQNRYADPSEIADLILFLASARARHICGEVISINGGLYMD